jgi:hypothetical protein
VRDRPAALDGGALRPLGSRYAVAVFPFLPGAAVLALYRLRWALDDIAISVAEFRSRHQRTADTEHAWLSLERIMERIARPGHP